MTTDRCPACSAAVSPGAPWCTLCYADLRPREPEAVEPQPVAVGASAPAASAAFTSPVEPVAVAPAVAPALLAPDPILDAPVVSAAEVAGREAAFWPCTGCGARVPMEDDACSTCGASFLPGDSVPSVSLPGVGDLRRLDRSGRLLFVLAGAFLVMIVFLAVAFVLGSVL